MRRGLSVIVPAVAAFCGALCAAGEPVAVSTAAELAAAIAGNPSGSYVLAADIDCAGWTTPASFPGILDGAGHRIVHTSDKPLFGILSGVLRNVVVDGRQAHSGEPTAITPSEGDAFGIVATSVVGGEIDDLVLRNFTVSTLNGTASVVGLVASEMRDGAVFRCVSVESSCLLRFGKSTAGGLVGKFGRTEAFAPKDEGGSDQTGVAVASIFDSTNAAPIVVIGGGDVKVGGIVGEANVADSTYKFTQVVSNCANAASISSEVSGSMSISAGGIVGRRSYNASGDVGVLLVTDCANLGDISSIGTAGNYGGIIGYTWRGARSVLRRCVNRGNIGDAADAAGNPVTGGNAGGILGLVDSLYKSNPIDCIDCANYGDVTCGSCAGGIFGRIDANSGHTHSFSAVNCANYGALSNVVEEGVCGQAFAKFGTNMEVGVCTITVSNCCFSTSEIYGQIAEQTNDHVKQRFGGNIFREGSGLTPKQMAAELSAGAEAMGLSLWLVGKLPDKTIAPELAPFCAGEYRPGFWMKLQ